MTGSGKISTLSSSSSEMSDAAGSSRRSCDGGSERGVGKGSDLDLLGRNFMTRKKRKSIFKMEGLWGIGKYLRDCLDLLKQLHRQHQVLHHHDTKISI